MRFNLSSSWFSWAVLIVTACAGVATLLSPENRLLAAAVFIVGLIVLAFDRYFSSEQAAQTSQQLKVVESSASESGARAALAGELARKASLGRSVDPDAANAIVKGMGGATCADARAVVLFLPHANEAPHMAGSLAELLRGVRVTVEGPSQAPLNTGSQQKPPVLGTRVVLSGSAPDSAKKLAGLIAEHIEEAEIEGISPAWPFTHNAYAMQVIVGSPKV